MSNIIAACVVAGMLTSNAPTCGPNEVLRVDVLDRCWCELVPGNDSTSTPGGKIPSVVGPPPVVVDPPPPVVVDPPGNGNGNNNGNRGVGNLGESDDPSPDAESNNPAGHTEPPGQSDDSSPGKSGDAPGQNK